jgi:hypothetical protein
MLSLLAIRSMEGRAWALLIGIALFVALIATAVAGVPRSAAGTGRAKGGKTHVGKTHRRRPAKKSPRCVTAKPKHAHRDHASSRKHAHPRKLKKCLPSRHAPKKSLVLPDPFAPSPASPASIVPTLTPAPVATVPPTPPTTVTPPAPTATAPLPTDTKPPSISGSTIEGQTLTSNPGEWKASPTSYGYQWQDCNTSGGSCSNIGGAKALSYKLDAGDVGHTMRVVVTASNSVGSAAAPSAQTGTVAASTGTQTNCIRVPSACGYPDATNTGVPAGTGLSSKSGDMTVTSSGTTIKDIALEGTIDVDANNTTIEDSEITVDGTQKGCSSPCGGKGIWIKEGVTGTIIRHVTCHGGAPTGENVTEFCIQNNDSSTKVSYVHLYNCTTGMVGPGEWSNNFEDQTGEEIPEEHYEDIYYGGGEGPLIVNHNTMLNPQGQTAVVFASVDFGDQTTLTITNNLMAGGGYMIYGGGSGSGGKVLGPVTVTGNRFSRKYYPEGGYYGVDSYMEKAVTTWSGNIWDETLKSVSEE